MLKGYGGGKTLEEYGEMKDRVKDRIKDGMKR